MNFAVGKLIKYAEANMELSKYDVAKLRFMLEVIFLNTMEFFLYFVIFAYIGKLVEYLIAFGVLMSVRIFSGGFHFKKYRYCVIVSFIVFAAVILVLPDVSRMHGVMEGLLLISLLLNIALAPVSKRNVRHSARSNCKVKMTSTIILLGYIVFLLVARGNPYASIITWILFIQAVQLIIGKAVILYAANVKQPMSS